MAVFDRVPSGLLRIVFRAPIWLYRAHLGWLLGHRFVYLVHRGRRSGRRRETVVEVVGLVHREVIVVSGYGERADWYRNLRAAPALEIRLGTGRYPHPAQRFLTRAQTVDLLADYRSRHPRTWRRLASAFGLPTEASGDQLDDAAQRLRAVAFTLVSRDPTPDRLRTHTLADGRRLGYAEWGDPDGYPVFYFHGTPGSRLEGALAHDAAKAQRFRLIAIDRPGYGCSTFQPNRTFRHWPADVTALADALGIAEFGVVGHSGAGPHLFACGVLLPDRVRFLGALGPWGPVATPQIMADLNRLDRLYARLARRAPWIMRASFAPLGWCAKYWPSLFLSLLRAAVSPADKAALRKGELEARLRDSELEAFRQGGRGGAHEALIAYRDWDLDLAQVRVPTHIWLGEQDIFVSHQMGQYLQHTIPAVDFHWVPGAGHLDVNLWDDILAACATHL